LATLNRKFTDGLGDLFILDGDVCNSQQNLFWPSLKVLHHFLRPILGTKSKQTRYENISNCFQNLGRDPDVAEQLLHVLAVEQVPEEHLVAGQRLPVEDERDGPLGSILCISFGRNLYAYI
jgi:hypothetical protein